MSVIHSILLGIIQGITEFLPISSSGHLAVIENFFQINDGEGLLFFAILHLGTLASVIVAFWPDVKRLFVETLHILGDLCVNMKHFIHNKTRQDALRYRKIIHNNYRKFAMLLWISTLPTAIVGILLRNTAAQMTEGLLGPGIGFLITATALFVAHAAGDGENLPREVGMWTALVIGLAQGFAVLPGISRLGITMTVCLLCGFKRRFAVKYAFLAGVIPMLGSAVWELRSGAAAGLNWGDFGVFLVGAVVACIIGLFAIRVLIQLVEKRRLQGFAVYCLLVGLGALCCSFLFL